MLGDTVCGGFSQPIRVGYAEQIYVIMSGEPLALYQTNNIAAAVNNNVKPGGKVGLAGLINNMRGFDGEKEVVEKFAEALGVPVIEHIPRSDLIQRAEFDGKTVIEAFPDSNQASIYKKLAEKILTQSDTYAPRILGMKEIKEIMRLCMAKTA
ncbi:MAG: hypothetical protein D9V47_14125 [Clostridia bacterium]|nr:MAG: hypothetical protein D9V47_14125 [Clostridia bacterium]